MTDQEPIRPEMILVRLSKNGQPKNIVAPHRHAQFLYGINRHRKTAVYVPEARIEADAATIREQYGRIASLTDRNIALREHSDAAKEEIAAWVNAHAELKAQNAAQAEEIANAQGERDDANEDMLKAFAERDELRARLERYEGLLIEHEDLTRKDVCQKLDAEARAIRARKEGEKR